MINKIRDIMSNKGKSSEKDQVEAVEDQILENGEEKVGNDTENYLR